MCFAQSVAELKLTQMLRANKERETIGCVSIVKFWKLSANNFVASQKKRRETSAIERERIE